MNNIFLITKREYLTQAKKKSFVILTLLAPLLLVGFGVLIAVMFKANETKNTIDVIDNSGIFKEQLKSTPTISYVYVPQSSEKALLSSLKEMKGTSGVLILPPLQNHDFATFEKNTKLYLNTKIGFDTKQKIAADISGLVKKVKIQNLGITEAQLAALDQSFNLNTKNVVDDHASDSDFTFSVKYGLAVLLMYVTFMFIIIYGVRVMRSVLEEKNNRVVEIIISSVKPFQLMMGKILGVTLIALTQFIIWIAMSLAAALIFNVQSNTTAMGTFGQFGNILEMVKTIFHSLLALDYGIIIFVFLVFFILGYIFYSSMYAAIGSAVDNETETQQFTLFAIIPLMLGMYGSFSIMNNPDGPMGFWLSMIPFTSPVAMIARIPFGVPAWQIILSILILFATTLLMIYIAAKVYRVGILMYGNKATLKELWKWIKN